MRDYRRGFSLFEPAFNKSADRILVYMRLKRGRRLFQSTALESLIDHVTNNLRLCSAFLFGQLFRHEAPSTRRPSVLLASKASRSLTRALSRTPCPGSSVAIALQISISAGFRPWLFANSAWNRSETFLYTFS